MKTDLIPIKVKIKYGLVNGEMRHIFPSFNEITAENRGNMDWSYFIDSHGTGWHYDHFSGIGEIDAVNPDSDVWFGCTCVPKPFADEAASKFPGDVQVLTEVEFEDFFNNRAHKHEADNVVDKEVLASIKVREDLGMNVAAEKAKAIDPNDPYPGVNKNLKKTWKDYKKKVGLTIHATKRKAQ